jgi:hypothetical protein
MTSSLMIFCDNSRRNVSEKCMRKRWWNYEYLGKGIEPIRKGKSEFPLLTGTGVHTGVEELLEGEGIDYAASKGAYIYDTLQCPTLTNERDIYLMEEQKALVEGIVRAWHVTRYDSFVKQYEVLDIEREESVELAPGVVWMSRPDLLVRRRSDGALFIVNLKTTKKADERWVSQWPLDAQTLSEVVAVENRLTAEAHSQIDAATWNAMEGNVPNVKLSGVIILGLLKGETLEYPEGSGLYYHNSPLIWAWNNVSGKPHPMGEWTPRWKWSDEEGNHTLGKGWRKREIWLYYPGGVKAWIEHLAASDPALLEEQVVELPPILRSEQQIQSWRHAVIHQERIIRHNRDHSIGLGDHPLRQVFMDELFPMSTSSGNCLWPSKCSYFGICHENMSQDDDSLYQIRVPNHPQEGL